MKLLLAYILVVAIWATTPLSISWSGHVDWFFGVASRVLISAIVIIPVLFWITREPFSFKRQDLKVYFSASIGLIGGMTPIYFASQTMPSGWISILFGLTPIFTASLSMLLFKDFSLSKLKWLGILLSFSGLLFIFLPSFSAPSGTHPQFLLGISMALTGVFCHSLSLLLVKKINKDTPDTHIVAGMLWISGLTYLAIDPSFMLQWPKMDNKALGAILYLGIIGSVLGFILFYYVLHRVSAIKAALITLITPVVAIMLGITLNQEPFTWFIGSGVVLVILGLVLFQFSQQIKQRLSYLK